MTAKLTASADGTKVTIGNAAEDALQIDSVAKTIKALPPYTLKGVPVVAFRAYKSVLQSMGDGSGNYVVFETEVFDAGNAFTPGTGQFKPTIAGYYQLNASAQISLNGVATSATLSIRLNGNDVAQDNRQASTPTPLSAGVLTCSALIYMNGTTDEARCWTTTNGLNPFLDVTTVTQFSGALVSPA